MCFQTTLFGFRRGWGAGDAISAVHRHIDLALAQRFGRTAVLALDWAKAFDFCNHQCEGLSCTTVTYFFTELQQMSCRTHLPYFLKAYNMCMPGQIWCMAALFWRPFKMSPETGQKIRAYAASFRSGRSSRGHDSAQHANETDAE